MMEKECEECYSKFNRITPLLKPLDCLSNHTQYICGTCGRCICIEHDDKRGLQRWNFPFSTLDKAKLYLRTADYTVKRSCSIYKILNRCDRASYKIFENTRKLEEYLVKNKDKHCENKQPVFTNGKFIEFDNTEVRKLTDIEIKNYLADRKD